MSYQDTAERAGRHYSVPELAITLTVSSQGHSCELVIGRAEDVCSCGWTGDPNAWWAHVTEAGPA